MLEGLGVVANSNNIDNEIIVMGSRTIVAQTLLDTKQYVIYYKEGMLRDTELYKTSPILADMTTNDLRNLTGAIELELEQKEDSTWDVTYPSKIVIDDDNIESTINVKGFSSNNPNCTW